MIDALNPGKRLLFLLAALASAPAAATPLVSVNEGPGVITSALTSTTLGMASYIAQATSSFFGSTTTPNPSALNTPLRYDLSQANGGVAASGQWHVWLAHNRSSIAYQFDPLRSSGHTGATLLGIDYTLNRSLVLGVALSDERTRVDTSYNSGYIHGTGNTVAPYLSWQVSNGWTLDASAGAGRTRLSTLNSGETGSNHDERSFASIGIRADSQFGKWLLTTKSNLMTARDSLSAYTTSGATAVAARKTRVNQARIGMQAAYDGGNWMPYAGVALIHDLSAPKQEMVAGEQAANDRNAVQVSVGATFSGGGPIYGGVAYVSERARSEIRNNQVLLNLGIRF